MQDVVVTQGDRDAGMAMLNHAFRNAPKNCLRDVEFDDIAEAFASHRTNAVEEWALRVEALFVDVDVSKTDGGGWLTDPIHIDEVRELKTLLASYRGEQL